MGKVLNAEMLHFMFESANMHRWNDHLRPLDLTEQDKQAHKAVIVWVIGKYDEEAGNKIDWPILIEHTLFEFIRRIVLTDLKPQVYHLIMAEKREQANEFVMKEFDRNVPNANPGFRNRLFDYLASKRDSREDRIIDAAHYLATKWEFDIIYQMNLGMFDVENTKDTIYGKVSGHLDLPGVVKVMLDKGTKDFINLFGQLRFQQRWARTPRIPKTTVLGHSLMVANSIFLHDLDMKVSERQIYNDYYSALFHDLPEVLTKDVISPVKKNVSGLAGLLESYEHKLVESKIMPLLPDTWHQEMRFMIYDPFEDSDHPTFGERAGTDIKSCDLLGAFVEAHVSACYGVDPKSLADGGRELKTRLLEAGGTIDLKKIIGDFENLKI